MGRGGTRAGAGRPKGARNRKTVENEEAVRASGLTPLEYLTGVYQDVRADEARRIDAAKAAAPYVHAKLSQVDARHSGPEGGPIINRIELVAVAPDGNREA